MELGPGMAGALLAAALLLGAAGVVGAAVALAGQRRVRRAYALFATGSRDDVLTLLRRHIDEVERLRGEVAALRRYADELRELARGAVSGVGIVRYDAFDDMGGRMSFSTAMLDERGDGVVVSAINGRTETRVYAKPLVGGSSRHNLSSEELAAVEEALAAAGRRGRARRGAAALSRGSAADAS